MDKFDDYIQKMIGNRTSRDIYSDSGDLLMPTSTIITYDHMMLLKENGVTLEIDDVTFNVLNIETNSIELHKTINDMVERTSEIFLEIRRKRKVPLADLRKDVIPMIHDVSDSQHLLHLFVALQPKDDYTQRHNIAVGIIANLIGKWMELNRHNLLQLTTAALLHDVGKMLIPETILNKPGKFTAEEDTIMQKHTTYGHELLQETIGINHRQALVALQHHERMDGTGYPLGIKKDNIDLFSRIVSIADVFHAMTSNRVYRNHSSFYEVLSEMETDMFGVLDPTVTMLFIEKTMNCLIGYSVLLTDGREGIILMVPKSDPTRPLIKVGEEFVDLSKELSLHIDQIIS